MFLFISSNCQKHWTLLMFVILFLFFNLVKCFLFIVFFFTNYRLTDKHHVLFLKKQLYLNLGVIYFFLSTLTYTGENLIFTFLFYVKLIYNDQLGLTGICQSLYQIVASVSCTFKIRQVLLMFRNISLDSFYPWKRDLVWCNAFFTPQNLISLKIFKNKVADSLNHIENKCIKGHYHSDVIM